MIVPVYNVEPYIHQCIDSIINQTYKDLEILLIDDGSPDNCGAICDEYAKQDSRIRVFHTENRGLSAARNLGLKEAKGEYIGFVDSDDWVEPYMYEKLLEAIQENETDISICGYCKEADSATETIQHSKTVLTRKQALSALLDLKIENSVWNKLYSKALFQKIHFPENRDHEDSFIMHEIIGEARKTVTIPDICIHYRNRIGSISTTRSAKHLIELSESRIARYTYIKENEPGLFFEKQNELLQYIATSISRTWRWWYGCNKKNRQLYADRIEVLRQFAREKTEPFPHESWPLHLRFTLHFVKYNNTAVFMFLYYLTNIYKRMERKSK